MEFFWSSLRRLSRGEIIERLKRDVCLLRLSNSEFQRIYRGSEVSFKSGFQLSVESKYVFASVLLYDL